MGRQAVEESGNEVGIPFAAGHGKAFGIYGGLHERGNRIRSELRCQPHEQMLVDGNRAAEQSERRKTFRHGIEHLEHCAGLGGSEDGERVVGKAAKQVGWYDQALGVHTVSPSPTIFEPGRNRAGHAVITTGEGMEVDACSVRCQVEERVVRGSPGGQFPRIGLPDTCAAAHQLVTGCPVCLGRCEDGLLDVCHGMHLT